MSANQAIELPNERAQHLLRVLVTKYIREGQPVGSRTLSRDSGLDLSPATVRNVMSDLEELGFITAPHTSAGRVPTDKGYRFFVDTLIRLRPPSRGELERIRAELDSGQDDSQALVHRASELLSGVTRLAGLVTVPRQGQTALRHVEFLPLSDRRVLAILVVNDHEVQNRIVHVERDYGEEELRRAANYLNETYAGRSIESIRVRLVQELQAIRESVNAAMMDVIEIASRALADEQEAHSAYVMSGQTNLMEFQELSDVDKLRRLFEVFNRQRDLLQLLDGCLQAEGVQLFIGAESGYQVLDGCTVVTAPYTMDDEVVGVLGVVGPMRMAYDRVIPIVDVTAKLLGLALNPRQASP